MVGAAVLDVGGGGWVDEAVGGRDEKEPEVEAPKVEARESVPEGVGDWGRGMGGFVFGLFGFSVVVIVVVGGGAEKMAGGLETGVRDAEIPFLLGRYHERSRRCGLQSTQVLHCSLSQRHSIAMPRRRLHTKGSPLPRAG